MPRALRDRMPVPAMWFSSPELKAVSTAPLLIDAPVEVVPGLREHVRDSTEWVDDREVGHGAAWTLVQAALRGEEPHLEWWAGLSMPRRGSLPGRRGAG